MSELLIALVAASKVGFEAPKCAQCWPCKSCDASGLDMLGGRCIRCDGTCKAHTPGISQYGARINVPVTGVDPDCDACHATGLDASDPERLIGRAVVWIRAQRAEVEFRTCQWGDGRDTHAVNAWFLASTKVIDLEEHDGTPTGLATALLRLVARVGGAA